MLDNYVCWNIIIRNENRILIDIIDCAWTETIRQDFVSITGLTSWPTICLSLGKTQMSCTCSYKVGVAKNIFHQTVQYNVPTFKICPFTVGTSFSKFQTHSIRSRYLVDFKSICDWTQLYSHFYINLLSIKLLLWKLKSGPPKTSCMDTILEH